MTRAEMEAKINEYKNFAKAKIEAMPIKAFFVALFAGFVLGVFKKIALPLITIIALVIVVFYLLGDQTPSGE